MDKNGCMLVQRFADGEEAQWKERDQEDRGAEGKGEGGAVLYLADIDTIRRAAIQ